MEWKEYCAEYAPPVPKSTHGTTHRLHEQVSGTHVNPRSRMPIVQPSTVKRFSWLSSNNQKHPQSPHSSMYHTLCKLYFVPIKRLHYLVLLYFDQKQRIPLRHQIPRHAKATSANAMQKHAAVRRKYWSRHPNAPASAAHTSIL